MMNLLRMRKTRQRIVFICMLTIVFSNLIFASPNGISNKQIATHNFKETPLVTTSQQLVTLEEEVAYSVGTPTNIIEGKIPTTTGGQIIVNAGYATDAKKQDLVVESAKHLEIRAGEEGGWNNGYNNWEDTWIQYDFGRNYDDIYEVNIYRPNYKDNRPYHAKDVIVEFSMDENFTDKQVVFAREDVQVRPNQQKIIFEQPIQAKYMRIYQKGHRGGWGGYSSGIYLSEVEVIAGDYQSEIENVAMGKRVMSEEGTVLLEGTRITDGSIGNQYADGTDTSWLYFDGAQGSNNKNTGYIQFDLGQSRELVQINLYRMIYSIGHIKEFKDVTVEVSNDKSFIEDVYTAYDGHYYCAVTNDNAVERLPQTIYLNEPVNGRYVRITSGGWDASWDTNTIRKVGFSEIEIYALPTDEPQDPLVDTNLLLYKQPTSSFGKEVTVSGGGGGAGQTTMLLQGDAVTDGDKSNVTVENGYYAILEAGEETGGADNGYSNWHGTWIQYDLGKAYETIHQINIYRPVYWDRRTYTAKDVKVEFSMTENFDQDTTTVVFDTADVTVRSNEHQQIIFNSPQSARYIRVHQNGHRGAWGGYSNKTRYNEIEVIASIPESEIPLPPPEAQPQNIAQLKPPYSEGKSLIHPENLVDQNLETYTTQESPGNHAIQYNFKNNYLIKEINFKLETGVTYPNVKVKVSNRPTSGFDQVYSEIDYMQGDTLQKITFETPVRASNVRFEIDAGIGNQAKIAEIQIWATGTSYDELPPAYEGVRHDTTYTELVWSDEFNGEVIDETKWTIVDGQINYAAIYDKQGAYIKKEGNESYLALRSKNYGSKEDLVAAGIEPDLYGNQVHSDQVTWLSGRIESKDKYAVEQGRVAVRAKANGTRGIWPAIWMLSQDEKGHNEIDILEYPQYNAQQAYNSWATNHFGRYGIDKGSHSNNGYIGYEAWSENFHVYEVEWNQEAMHFYIDGVKIFTTQVGKGRDSMHRRPMFIILETQVGGGGWAGHTYNDLTDQDTEYLVDWVRVYQEPSYKKVYFDNLDRLILTDAPSINTDYFVSPIETSPQEELLYLTHGVEQYEDKDNFNYGGQPRYEVSRYTCSDGTKQPYLIYNVNNLSDVHLSTYYQVAPNSNQSIRSLISNNVDIDYKFYTSTTGEEGTWQSIEDVTIFNNTVDAHPSYARHTYDIYDLPAGTNYLKIVFPDVNGKTYNHQGQTIPIRNTDIQLAKVILVQDYN